MCVFGALRIGVVVGAVDEHREAEVVVKEVGIDPGGAQGVLGAVGLEVAVFFDVSEPGFFQRAGGHAGELFAVLLGCAAL